MYVMPGLSQTLCDHWCLKIGCTIYHVKALVFVFLTLFETAIALGAFHIGSMLVELVLSRIT